MPTHDRHSALTLDTAREHAARVTFTASADDAARGVGLEPEFFPIRVAALATPRGRLRLAGEDGVVAAVDELAATWPGLRERSGGGAKGTPEFALVNGGRLTFEPGAQVEHSTTVHPDAASALSDVADVERRLQETLSRRGAVLAALGVDLWHDVIDVPQQFEAGRYVAQAAYYERRGPCGRIMMRHTCSLQMNVDLGPAEVLGERYLAANLLSPLLTATFAASPGPDGVSTRSLAWQSLDPSRTGFPSGLTEVGRLPGEIYADAVLEAGVMLLRSTDGRFHPGDPGFTFGHWIEHGHELGWPTLDDLDYHLSTVFFEVRARGFLELRAGEAVPDPLRTAAVVLVTSAIYDETARGDLLDLLLPHRRELTALWRRAASAGLRDELVGELAARTWAAAAAGAGRLAEEHFVAAEHLRTTHRFLDDWVAQRRMPADALAEALAEGPADALAWASSAWSRRLR